MVYLMILFLNTVSFSTQSSKVEAVGRSMVIHCMNYWGKYFASTENHKEEVKINHFRAQFMQRQDYIRLSSVVGLKYSEDSFLSWNVCCCSICLYIIMVFNFYLSALSLAKGSLYQHSAIILAILWLGSESFQLLGISGLIWSRHTTFRIWSNDGSIPT